MRIFILVLTVTLAKSGFIKAQVYQKFSIINLDTKVLLAGEPGVGYNLKLLLGWINYQDKISSEPLFYTQDLVSKKHFNDIYYDRKLSFVHMVKNQSNKTQDITLSEFFPHYLQMYTKDIQIDIYSSVNGDTEGHSHSFISTNSTKRECTDYKLGFSQGSIGLWFKFSNIILKPGETMLMKLKLKKYMISTQSIPVDISMDANVPPLPILYKEVDVMSPIKTQSKIAYSQSWVIVIMEPDFSMAFNLNAMFFGVLGAALHWLFTTTVDIKDIMGV